MNQWPQAATEKLAYILRSLGSNMFEPAPPQTRMNSRPVGSLDIHASDLESTFPPKPNNIRTAAKLCRLDSERHELSS